MVTVSGCAPPPDILPTTANAASFVVYGSFLTMTILLVAGEDAPSFTKKDAILAVTNLLTLALGFLFGKASKD